MSVINTNIKALTSQGSLSNVNKAMETTMERLSTGLRINSAKDDAAGLAITNRMTSQIRGFAVAIRNSNDGISMAQTAEGAMGQVTSMLQRMRELSVQAGNGAMSDADRGNIQQEVSQLKMQIDDVANKTNHNNIKLLDGSAGKITLQTGVYAGDTMDISFGSVKTKDIGLGSRAALSSAGGVTTGVADTANAAFKDGSLSLNGVSVGASLAASDDLSYTMESSSAIAKVAAINKVAEQSGVYATVGKTTVAGNVMTAATATTAGQLKINGVETATFYMSGDKEIDRTTIVGAINDISARTGVRAINTHDDNQGISLVAEDGRNITTDFGASDATASMAMLGLAGAGTYVGSFDLNTKDGSDITVGTSVANVQTSQLVSGLNLGTYAADTAQMVTSRRSAVLVAPSDATGAGVLGGNTLVINGVGIAAAVGNDDTASFSSATAVSSTKASSAIAIAAAINKSTALTGVTAKADENVVAGTGFTAGEVTAIELNGVSIPATLEATTSTREDVLSLFNAHTGDTGVVASAYGDGIKLTAADGRNITLMVTGAGGAAALGLQGVEVGTATGVPATHYAGVQLTSDKSFTVNSGSDGDQLNFKQLGFTEGTFGGSNPGVKIAEIDVSTMAGASTAIQAIDAAINTVSADQAKAGAFQNRLDAVVSNLTESTQNMSASRSRILDTDYATETTNLARSQIISQAATAMLAQANQSAQSVLSLLK